MKQKTYITATTCTLLLLAAAACSEVDIIGPDGGELDGRTVEVTLKLSAEQPTDATPAETGRATTTRTIDDPDASPYSAIKNVWVLQFNGTTDASTLVGAPTYIPDYDDGNQHVVNMVSGTNRTVYFLANTFDPALAWQEGFSLSNLKARYMEATTEDELHVKDETTAVPGDYPNNGDYYLLMNGTYTGNINSATVLNARLYRNTVRLDFRLKNTTTGATAVTIDSLQARAVIKRQHIYNAYVSPTVMYPADGQEIVYNYKPVSAASGVPDSDHIRYRFYLAANQRGTNAAITNPWEKNSRNAPGGATHIRVYGSYTDDGGRKAVVTYTYYPGDNTTTDFNLKPDHTYTLNAEINGIGDPAADPCIQHNDTRDFAAPGEERANSYILNPITGETRLFRIPVDRINVFWGGKGYADEPANTIAPTDNWTAEILWSDFTTQDTDPTTAGYFKLVKTTGTGAEGDTDGYFTVETGPLTAGNTVIAVKKQGTTTILWSWHLWITDYDPYQGTLAGQNDAINVPGGLYLRSTNAAKLPNGKWLGHMDRMLGADSPTDLTPMLYQYGRKDPFYPAANFALDTRFTVQSSALTLPQSVTTPTTAAIAPTNNGLQSNDDLYDAYDWVTPRINQVVYPIWRDIALPADKVVAQRSKSLFDPCPPGWRVPENTNEIRWQSTIDNDGDAIGRFQTTAGVWSIGFPYGWRQALSGIAANSHGSGRQVTLRLSKWSLGVFPQAEMQRRRYYSPQAQQSTIGPNFYVFQDNWENQPYPSMAGLATVLPVRMAH
ncbi:MAG: DUF4906 domain-containing protein [Mediterranea sp.]|jgi:hypothetical protein|nr:DUF4906 domain-containing protein [Mediterranea sp.]